MDISEFDYPLPGDRIAQEPLPDRDASKLLVLDRRTAGVSHHVFRDLPDLLDPQDLLVMNDTKVIPARVLGKKAKTGGSVEFLLLEDRGSGFWECLARGKGRLRVGTTIEFAEGVRAVVESKGDSERIQVRFTPLEGFRQWLARRGRVPLPPYILRPDRPEDRERYQTVYARAEGAVAAPTAGLHFTHALMQRLEERGIERVSVTLHVGPGTFRPIRTRRVEDHAMDPERTHVSPDGARRIQEAQAAGRCIAAVGTTVVRTLEGRAVSGPHGEITLQPGWAPVSLYISPGYRFRLVGALVTNFHLPRSTLLVLVSAFAGRERILEAYEEALRKNYRFYSYGDAMLIL
ncbi:MAG: tRNA preQ1(34) S-adenosylmethionine ribosyltransferase-isomerase QueA [Nitrospinota bacterium]